MAIKETAPDFLAPTLEKAIDTLKNSEVFMPQFQNLKPDDQMTSDLVSSLISVSVYWVIIRVNANGWLLIRPATRNLDFVVCPTRQPLPRTA